MARKQENEYRDPVTKRYAYFGRFERPCLCGHTLGIHIAGGFDCGARGCDCEKFRPAYKPRAGRARIKDVREP
jgi:hypothetical protein